MRFKNAQSVSWYCTIRRPVFSSFPSVQITLAPFSSPIYLAISRKLASVSWKTRACFFLSSRQVWLIAVNLRLFKPASVFSEMFSISPRKSTVSSPSMDIAFIVAVSSGEMRSSRPSSAPFSRIPLTRAVAWLPISFFISSSPIESYANGSITTLSALIFILPFPE